MIKIKEAYKDYGFYGLKELLKYKLGKIPFIKLKKKDLEIIYFENFSNAIYLRQNTTDYSVFKQIFLKKEYDIKLKFEPEVIIDAGSNIGLASIYFNMKYPKAKIISIEPEKSNFNFSIDNITSNNIIPLKRALSNQSNQFLNVIDNGNGHWSFITELKSNNNNYTIVDTVKTITINEIMVEYEIEFIDILKIDIEGAEKELFESDFELWLPKTRCLIIELHDRVKKDSSRSFFKAINKYNFTHYKKGENLVYMNSQFSSFT